jgi:hypothetical protein
MLASIPAGNHHSANIERVLLMSGLEMIKPLAFPTFFEAQEVLVGEESQHFRRQLLESRGFRPHKHLLLKVPGFENREPIVYAFLTREPEYS